MKKLQDPLGIDPMLFAVPPRDEKPFIPTAHYASSLTGCLREHYYRWTGAPVTNPASLIQRQKMEAGDDDAITFRRRLAENCVRYGLRILDERPEFPVVQHYPPLKYPIRGRIDVVLDVLLPDGQKETWLVEFKSMAGRGAERLVGHHRGGEWVPGDLNEYPNYVAQVWAYMLFFPEQVDHVFLIAWDRVSRLHQTYELRLDPTNGLLWWSPVPKIFPTAEDPLRGYWRRTTFTWKEVTRRLAVLEEHVERRLLPPRYDPVTGKEYKAKVRDGRLIGVKDDDKTIGWKCAGYCEYADLCWGLVVPEETKVEVA